MNNKVVLIDGSSTGPTFGGPGGATAVGGIPIRNRRDAVIYLNGIQADIPMGDWFVRPVVDSYVHDFQTDHSGAPGYLNYVDRWDVSGGFDVGHKKVFGDQTVFLGYRYGHQNQSELLGNSALQYSNDYQRLLLGLVGQPLSWLKYDLLGGPDFRDFDSTVTAGFDQSPTVFYYTGSVTIMPSKGDSIKLSAKKYMQPSFGGRSAYEDSTYDLTWRHTIDNLTFGAGIRAYNGDWPSPITRDDWIYTASGLLAYKFNKSWNAELTYSYDWAESDVPNTSGREFTRNLVAFGAKYTFK